jgi:DNA primase
MAGRIPRHFIDDLLARTDLVGLVDQRVRLKKAGKNYQACCPFHNEKSPSFTVSADKQFYHCFGCGAHGNAISFLMEYDHLEFVEAVEDLASAAGVPVEREQDSGFSQNKPTVSAQNSKDLYDLMQTVSRFYQHQLRNHARSKEVIDYLKGRGLSGEIVQKYAIGFAPDEWDAVGKQFGTSTAISDQLLECGVLIENEEKRRRYDRFRDRVMFPIRDRRGRYIGFGGRVLGDGTPKYLNSPETPLFHKGRELYGLYEVRQAYKSIPQILVVEGYMDVVSLAQFEVDYAVATLGTSTTAEHLQTLFRASNQVICCYDGDRAGRDAAWRALENALPQLRDDVALKFMFLPDGEDPDTLVRQIGKEGFEKRMKEAMLLSDFMFQRLSSDIDISTDAGLSHLADRARTLIHQVQADFYQEMLKNQLAKWLRWDTQRLALFFKDSKKKSNKPTTKAMRLTPMRRAIAIILQNPAIAQDAPDLNFLRQLPIKGGELLIELTEHALNKPDITTAQLLERWRGRPESEALNKMAGLDLEFDDRVDAAGYSLEFNDILTRFVEQLLQQRFDELNTKSLTGKLSLEEMREMDLLIKELRK